jgi:3-oxoacyl-[acyl-carrier protein] reductase
VKSLRSIAPLRDEVALVTGGSRGIGFESARRLAVAGAAVALVARDRERLDQAAAALSTSNRLIFPVIGDVTDQHSMELAVEQTEERFGSLSILIHSAGVGYYGPLAEQDPEDWRRVIDVNLFGCYYATRAALPAIRRRGHGQIIAVSSTNGRVGRPNMTAYCASKAAIEGFMRALAAELEPEPIRCATIVPGSTLTDFGGRSREDRLASGARFLEPDDVADAIVQLALLPDRAWLQELVLWPR